MSPNTWYYLTLVKSGSTYNLYQNGILVDTATNANSISDTSNSHILTIGSYSAQGPIGGNFGGRIDEVAIWSRALSGPEINALHNSGNGLSLIQ